MIPNQQALEAEIKELETALEQVRSRRAEAEAKLM
jgi:hypothetical protein